MKRPRAWNVLESRKLGDYRVFSVLGLRSRRIDQTTDSTFYRIAATDWANVVALTSDKEVIVVRQYRHGAATETLEIPGGMVDAGETPMEAAARELLEETGYGSDRWLELGSVNPNPALFANRLHSYLALDCVARAESIAVGDEETVVERISQADLFRRVDAGEVDHALVLTALFWWRRYQGRSV